MFYIDNTILSPFLKMVELIVKIDVVEMNESVLDFKLLYKIKKTVNTSDGPIASDLKGLWWKP